MSIPVHGCRNFPTLHALSPSSIRGTFRAIPAKFADVQNPGPCLICAHGRRTQTSDPIVI
jgi:hypothetical protein